jgi:uronate dehydrogenase
MKKIVLTGAAGNLGSHLREPLSKMCDTLLSTDIADDIGTLYDGESYVRADLAEMDQIAPLMDGADMVVHFGAFVDEGPFEKLLGPNFIGSYNIWESGYRAGVRRVVYASSIHAVGMHPKQTAIGIDADHRPDGFYGLAKCFTEDLGKMYWDKRGMESVHLRILSASNVTNPRALGSWLSYPDLIQLVTRAVDSPTVGFSVVYGVSNNDRCPVDNSGAAFLGYRPRDNAEQFAEKILADAPPASTEDPAQMFHGGPFAAVKIGESGLAQMNIVIEKKNT